MLESKPDPYRLAFTFGICPIGDTLTERYHIPGTPAWIHVVKLANRPRSVNLKIKIDSTLVEAYGILQPDGT